LLISICIPTYNSGDKLTRLLDSIKIQTFTDFEIIISDDSKNEEIKHTIDTIYPELNIKYFHNAEALGTPNNWNNAVAKASGDWIKLMHHDDWFTQPDALEIFLKSISQNSAAKLIFCSFNYVDVETQKTTLSACSKWDIFLLKQNYLNLYKNFIGNPSCTLIHKSYRPYEYDKTIKWLIDFDFYTEYFMREKEFTYIDIPLIAFGVHSSQVTANVQKNPNVEIPESYIFFKKYGIKIMKNIFVYDFFWRMYRNLALKNIEQLEKYLRTKNNYNTIENLIGAQNLVGGKMLQNGFVSKGLMLAAYLRNRFFN
jgi:glycosyltransferase involved in cell wall biosynthesis